MTNTNGTITMGCPYEQLVAEINKAPARLRGRDVLEGDIRSIPETRYLGRPDELKVYARADERPEERVLVQPLPARQ